MGLNSLLAGPFGVVIVLLFLVWAILMFFAPFFWYGAWYRAKELDKRMESANRRLDEANRLLMIIAQVDPR